jgi:hypothetical protein
MAPAAGANPARITRHPVRLMHFLEVDVQEEMRLIAGMRVKIFV